MPLTPEFLEAIHTLDKNWSMGVESVSPFLYSMIRCIQPRRALEVGAGYSSLFILQALADNAEEHHNRRAILKGQVRSDQHTGLRRIFKGRHPLPLAETDFYTGDYDPRLHVIDDGSHPATSARKVAEVARKLNLGHLLQFHDGLFQGMSRQFSPADLPLDFVWFDCGGLQEFLDEYWNLISPLRGILIIHSSLTNPAKRAVLKALEERLSAASPKQAEMVSFYEPHKWRQNSFTIIRKLSPELESLYTIEDD